MQIIGAVLAPLIAAAFSLKYEPEIDRKQLTESCSQPSSLSLSSQSSTRCALRLCLSHLVRSLLRVSRIFLFMLLILVACVQCG